MIRNICLALSVALSASVICSAQAPGLGSAAGFVLFSSTGAVGNTGATSQFTGNIGTMSGAITIGVNVNGVLHTADGSTTAAATSVLAAYLQLQLTPPTDTEFALTSYTLGNQDTLRAGVDSITTNTLLDDTLVLDGQNNANAVFIFKINGTFSSTSGATVLLINGALACNVFWQVNGAITTGSDTRLRGTFISNSGSVDLASGTLLEGRVLTSVAGAITTNSVLTYLPTGCGSTVLTGPAAPALGTIGCYALFTSNGANLNSGTTHLIGDVGTNMGLTTGYSALLVNGAIHSVPDVSTSTAASDLSGVYTYLNTLTPDIELLYPALFGRNLVLTPHTYLLNAATTLTDTLFLNAEGDTNAVFVMQINGAFSTSTHASIILMNGTRARNVFWKIEGATTLNDYAIMKGTFVSNNDAVTLNIGVALDGRALSTTGALAATSDSVTIPPLSCSLSPLPLGWIYFRGKTVNETVLLEWNISDMMNNGMFSIEKSRDAVTFTSFNITKASADGTQGSHYYKYTDVQPYSQTYYRIAHTGQDGRKSYSETIQVTTNAINGPAPRVYIEDAFINVVYSNGEEGFGTIQLYSIEGRKIISQPIAVTQGSTNYKIAVPANSGMYLLYIEAHGVRIYAGKVMVN